MIIFNLDRAHNIFYYVVIESVIVFMHLMLAKCKQRFLPEELSEDEVLNYIIKNKSLIMNILTPYEQERVSACIL